MHFAGPRVLKFLPPRRFSQMERSATVSRSPDVVSGALVFAGTRVPVQILIDYLKAGESLDRFLDGFPSVTRDQAEAFLDEACHALDVEANGARAA